MGYQTSFYMHIVNYVKLSRASQRTGQSMKYLISQVMYNYAKDHRKMQVEEGLVKYQASDRREKWKTLRIQLKRDDYELFTDMRKVMKRSVSYLVALAIKKYLDKIVGTILKDSFNYTSLVHDAAGARVNDVKCWILIWKIKTQQPTTNHMQYQPNK